MDCQSSETNLDFFFITNKSDLAEFVDQFGIRYVMVDLEILGKRERQSGRNTLISDHSVEDVNRIKSVLRNAELVVRVNPLHSGTAEEITECLAAGADLLMLPMFQNANTVKEFCEIVDGRAGVIPLVETAGAVRDLDRIVGQNGVERIHIGLNDLHLDMGRTFLFEPLADGTVDMIASRCRAAGVPFGIGGVSLIGSGEVPGETVLGEHARVGSTAAILSRTFHQSAENREELQGKIDFPAEVKKLRKTFLEHLNRSESNVESDRLNFRERVASVVARCA